MAYSLKLSDFSSVKVSNTPNTESVHETRTRLWVIRTVHNKLLINLFEQIFVGFTEKHLNFFLHLQIPPRYFANSVINSDLSHQTMITDSELLSSDRAITNDTIPIQNAEKELDFKQLKTDTKKEILLTNIQRV